jgi:hypothetical protein
MRFLKTSVASVVLLAIGAYASSGRRGGDDADKELSSSHNSLADSDDTVERADAQSGSLESGAVRIYSNHHAAIHTDQDEDNLGLGHEEAVGNLSEIGSHIHVNQLLESNFSDSELELNSDQPTVRNHRARKFSETSSSRTADSRDDVPDLAEEQISESSDEGMQLRRRHSAP